MRLVARLAVASFVFAAPLAARADTSAERGRYLVTIAGCNDCHTPGALLGKPDEKKQLAGSDTGFGDPSSGVWIGQNLTPDKETGLGAWSKEQIVTAVTKGLTPEGRQLSPIMPWPALSQLSHQDALAIADYLQSLPPVKNRVPGPYKAGETPAVPFISAVIPVKSYMALPKQP
jgi:mono/diheme cytochrome c family protein